LIFVKKLLRLGLSPLMKALYLKRKKINVDVSERMFLKEEKLVL